MASTTIQNADEVRESRERIEPLASAITEFKANSAMKASNENLDPRGEVSTSEFIQEASQHSINAVLDADR